MVGISIRNIDNCVATNAQFLIEDVLHDVVLPLKACFSGPIVIGGPAVGISGVELLEYLDLEMAIQGEGEESFVELLRRIQNGLPPGGTPGLIMRVCGRIVEEDPSQPICDLDSLSWDHVFDFVDLHPYRRFNAPIQVQSKRGCALKCTYCTYNRIEGRCWRLRDPQKLADGLESIIRKTGITEIEFSDSTFNYSLDHCKAVLRAIIAKRLDIRCHTMGINPGAVDTELVSLLRQAGFVQIDVGAESGCDATLRGLGKNFSRQDVLNAAQLLRGSGIAVTWYLLVGAPGETAATLRSTFATIAEAAAPWDLVCLGNGLRVYKGSPLAEHMSEKDPGCTADNFFHPVAFEPEELSLAEIKALARREALRHPNFLMFDEDHEPPALVVLGTMLLKRFAPEQPLWRLFILKRMVHIGLGINLLKRAVLELSNRQLFKALEMRRERPARAKQ